MKKREIKYRAWHPELKKMFYKGFAIIPTSPNWCATFIRGTDDETLQRLLNKYYRKKGDNIGGDYDLIDWTEYSKLIPLEFIGIKDSKGIDIYEGDILKSTGLSNDITGRAGPTITLHQRKRLHVVVSHDGSFKLKQKARSHKKKILKGGLIFRNQLVIIGNIYENPELLK